MKIKQTFMNIKKDYDAFTSEIESIAMANGIDYLSDECVDRENIEWAGIEEGTDDYWRAMLSASESRAGQYFEERGFDVNALLGRIVY